MCVRMSGQWRRLVAESRGCSPPPTSSFLWVHPAVKTRNLQFPHPPFPLPSSLLATKSYQLCLKNSTLVHLYCLKASTRAFTLTAAVASSPHRPPGLPPCPLQFSPTKQPERACAEHSNPVSWGLTPSQASPAPWTSRNANPQTVLRPLRQASSLHAWPDVFPFPLQAIRLLSDLKAGPSLS